MDPVLFLGFLAATLLIIATPGPSVAFATSQALRHGPRAALVAVAGDALGSVVHILIALGSLKTLMALSDLVLPWLQIGGGLVILWMAVRAFRAPDMGQDVGAAQDKATFVAGFVACVGNPKAIVFFVAFFPTFLSPDQGLLAQALVYGMVFIVLDAPSILGYALLAERALRREQGRVLRIQWLSGLGLGAVGFAMIVKGWRALPSS